MSVRRRSTSSVACVVAVLLAVSAAAFAARSYSDRVGDVKGGSGPDLTSLTLSSTRTTVTFRVRFTHAPPLRASTRDGWVDMLLIGIDVPPLGPLPVRPGGEWRGANFAVGTHGPSTTGLLVHLDRGTSRQVARFRVVTRGSSLVFSIPRRALGNPSWFTFNAAVARELADGDAGGGVDVAPEHGTFRYLLAR
jgi:hypothetical protein